LCEDRDELTTIMDAAMCKDSAQPPLPRFERQHVVFKGIAGYDIAYREQEVSSTGRAAKKARTTLPSQ
jgi:hypothetical protein